MGTPTLLVGAVRWSESERTLGGGEILKAVDWQERINVSALNDDLTTELVTAFSASDEHLDEQAVRKIVKLAQGNPLLAEMLVSDWDTSGAKSLVMFDASSDKDDVSWSPPDTLNSVLARQYEGLSNCAERLVRLLATAGRSMPSENLTRLLAVSPESFGNAVYALMERGIVSLDGNALGFRNDLHSEYVYSEMSKETRKYQHAHLAQHLSAAQDQNEFQHGLEASHHYLKAGWISEATELACNGAERAITCGAPQEAVKALEAVRNNRLGETNLELEILLAKAYTAQGSFELSRRILQSIRDLDANTIQRAIVANLWAEALHRGRLAENEAAIATAANNAVTAATSIGDQRLFLKAQQIAAEVAHESGTWETLKRIEDECTKLAEETDNNEVLGLANLTLGYCSLASGDPSAAAARFTNSAHLFGILKLEPALYRALTGLGMSATNLGHFDKALGAFSDAAATAARSGDTVANANALQNLGSLANELGRFGQAASYFRRAIELDTNISTSRVSTALYCNVANLSLTIGNLHEAGTFVATAVVAADKAQLWHHLVNVQLTGADLHLARGEQDKAWTLVEKALAITGDRYRLVPDLGQYLRLRGHYYSIIGDAKPVDEFTLTKVAHVLELRAFEEWCSQEDNQADAMNELAELGLLGVVAKLAAVGVRYGPLTTAAAELSGAEAVQVAFPDREWERIPSAVMD